MKTQFTPEPRLYTSPAARLMARAGTVLPCGRAELVVLAILGGRERLVPAEWMDEVVAGLGTVVGLNTLTAGRG